MTSATTKGPGHYEIRVRGPIGPMMLEAFPTLSAREDRDDTLLRGRLPDPSALYGVIHQLEILGLELLEVRRQDATSVD
jgi:monoterpene epsilon-lactone hydrolase